MSYKIVRIKPNKNIQIHYMSEFVEAAQNGDLDKVKRLFRPDIINARDHEKDTALLKASRNPNATHVVSFLLENGASTNDRDLIDQTPLIVASQHGCREIVNLLVKAGSDIKHKNQQGESALLSATQEGHIDIVKDLIRAGAEINEPNYDGETPILLATKLRQKKELVKLLIDAGADINRPNVEGETPIMFAKSKDIMDLFARGKRSKRRKKPRKSRGKSLRLLRKSISQNK